MTSQHKIIKKVLDNGLTILIRPNRTIPKVSVQLWYNVGSKDEKTGEKGLAHFIEHMIFKGTEKLSESDINMITHKLSGYCNAFTSYDYTGYLFDFPSQHWQEALPIMADCMQNCIFKQAHLNSELKAVIQELKMYRDNYSSSLIEAMISTMFPGHPYHHPIIGYKQDLWSIERNALVAFYKKHYIPNNATLVVVGDVDPDQVIQYTQEVFAQIPAKLDYKKEEFSTTFDITNTATTIYRDVQQPIVAIAYKVPGAKTGQQYELDILSWLLGSGKGSLLSQKLVDELQLVTEIESFCYDLFDQGIFFIYFQPKETHAIEKIITIIQEEIDRISVHGISDQMLTRAIKQAQADYFSILENNQKQAYFIGQTYLATGNENYLWHYTEQPFDIVRETVLSFLKSYFRTSLMHRGSVLPLLPTDKELWIKAQEASDSEDAKVLNSITREDEVQDGCHVTNIAVTKPAPFNFPRAQKVVLSNGLTILYYHNPSVAKVELCLAFKAQYYYEPDNLAGLQTFMSEMLLEGTHHYSSIELAQEIETLGMTIEPTPGYIKMSALSNDIPRGLEILSEILTQATFPEDSLEKVRKQLQANLHNFWDSPSQFCNQLAREAVYKNHPYHKNMLGSFETINSITRQDIIKAYHDYITPQESTLAIVGDLSEYNIPALCEQYLSQWHGPKVEDLTFPAIAQIKPEEIIYKINRDQFVLAFAGLSISRNDPDFDAVLLVDQIVTGGVLGSMSSQLFQLRERSGLFYTIGGSLLSHSDEQPGMVYIKTILSGDRLDEAKSAIFEAIDKAPDQITERQLEEAKNALSNTLIDYFATNRQIAATFLFLARFKLPEDYFDNRPLSLAKINLNQCKKAAKRLLADNKLITLKIGRF